MLCGDSCNAPSPAASPRQAASSPIAGEVTGPGNASGNGSIWVKASSARHYRLVARRPINPPNRVDRRRKFWLAADRSEPGPRDEQRIARLALDDARAALVEQRDRGEIDDTVVRHVQRYLDLQTMLLDYPDLEITESPFEATAPPFTEE